ncbi:MAG: cbb3-type cytochrome c oxidase subunit 3 [Pseudobdellovibrio sp.]|nr:cbb3-type cytochrome c oxidase subunit 3 [Pseudobdellovibrio sp.]
MKQEGLKFFTDTYLTIIGFLIFFSYFIYVTVNALRTPKKQINEFAHIPFSNGEDHGK